MSPPPLRLAILGCGEIAAVHATTLRRSDRPVELAFASRSPERAEAFARRHGGHALASYDAAFEDESVDAVLVTTPPSAHLQPVLAALEAGKDVVVEKPAFMTTGDFETAADASRRTGRSVLVAENYFYKPLRRRLERWIAAGTVGHPLMLSVDATKAQDFRGWRADPATGGGPLLESGVHWLNLLANVGMRVESVDAIASGPRPGDEMSVTVTLGYAGGTTGSLELSWEAYSPLGGARLSHLHGTRGTVTFESNGAFAFARGRRRALWVPHPLDASGFRPMWRDFLAALSGRPTAAFTLEHALQDVDLVERARAALRRRES